MFHIEQIPELVQKLYSDKQMETKHDRRTARTKRLLWEALVKLILKKGYEAVTVQDIIDEADIGRSTFYFHFESKEHLLLGSQPEFGHMLFNSSSDEAIDFTLIYEHAKKNKKVAKALLGKKGNDIITSHIKEVLVLKIQSFIEQSSTEKGDTITSFKIEATAAGLLSLLSHWIESDMKLSIPQMVSLSESLMEWVDK